MKVKFLSSYIMFTCSPVVLDVSYDQPVLWPNRSADGKYAAYIPPFPVSFLLSQTLVWPVDTTVFLNRIHHFSPIHEKVVQAVDMPREEVRHVPNPEQ